MSKSYYFDLIGGMDLIIFGVAFRISKPAEPIYVKLIITLVNVLTNLREKYL